MIVKIFYVDGNRQRRGYLKKQSLWSSELEYVVTVAKCTDDEVFMAAQSNCIIDWYKLIPVILHQALTAF